MGNKLKQWLDNDNKKKWFRKTTFGEWIFGFGCVLPNSIKGFFWLIFILLLASFFSTNSMGAITNNFGVNFNIIAALAVVSVGLIVGTIKS